MKRGKFFLLVTIFLFTVVLASCTKTLSESGFTPASTRVSTDGVNHTAGEIIDLRNAEVKRAHYAKFVQVGGTDAVPQLVSGSELWNDIQTVVPLDPTYTNCLNTCALNTGLTCIGTYYGERSSREWPSEDVFPCVENSDCLTGEICNGGSCSNTDYYVSSSWRKGEASTCTSTPNSGFLLPMCICKRT